MENKKNFDILYIAMILTIVGQCVVGKSFYFGQFAFLIANVIYLCRDFVLRRPRADKIKNICFTGITLGVILIEFFS